MAEMRSSKSLHLTADCGDGLQYNDLASKNSKKSVKFKDDDRTDLSGMASSKFEYQLETPAQNFVYNGSMISNSSYSKQANIRAMDDSETTLAKSIEHIELNEKSSSATANLENLMSNPFQIQNSTVLTESSPSNQIWFYFDSNFRNHGPFTSIEMAMWYLDGYFDESLILKRACDSHYTILSELIKISENKLPFLASHLIPPLQMSVTNVAEKTDKTPKVIQTAESSLDLSLLNRNLKQLQVKCSTNELGSDKTQNVLHEILGKEKLCLEDAQQNHKRENFIFVFGSPENCMKKYDLNMNAEQAIKKDKAQDKRNQYDISCPNEDEKKTSFMIKTTKLPKPPDQFLVSEDENEEPKKSTKSSNENLTKSQNSQIKINQQKKKPMELGTQQPKLAIPFNFGYSNADEASCEKSIHNLTREQSVKLEHAKALFPSFENESLSETNLESHIIDIGYAAPIHRCSVSPEIDAIAYVELDRMLQCGVIKESSSIYNSRPVIIREKEQLSICLDWRRLNAVTKRDIYVMPRKDLVLEKLKTANYISCIDLKAIYWQIPLNERSQQLTAFKVRGRPTYQFTRMPSGLRNSPQRMCRLIDKVVSAELREFTTVYLDYLLVFSVEFNAHIELIRILARCFRRANLTVNIEKSRFCLSKITYCGYIVRNGTFSIDNVVRNDILCFSFPQLKKTLEDFNKITSWYRRFIVDYDKIMEPLIQAEQIIKSTLPMNAVDSFILIKQMLTVVKPDFKIPFIIQCNATSTYIGGLLYQIDKNGVEHPIAYHLKRVSGFYHYSIVELECLAVVSSLRQFRPYIEGTTFRIFTDQPILMWIMNQPELDNRLARWSIEIQAFDFIIESRKDNRNGQPMSLTRVDASQKLRIENDLRNFMHFFTDYEKLKKSITNLPNQYLDYKIVDSLIYIRRYFSTGYPELDKSVWKLWIPAQLTPSILLEAHSQSVGLHRNKTDLVDFLQTEYYWPLMQNQAYQIVKNCEICKNIQK